MEKDLKEKIKKIINEIDNISQKSNNEDFNVAMYIYFRLGIFQFENYINEYELNKISERLEKCCTFFDEELNNDIDIILNTDIE